jgi:hypothetical protein
MSVQGQPRSYLKMTYEIIIEEQYISSGLNTTISFLHILHIKCVSVLYLYKNICHNFLTNQWEHFFFPSENDYSVQLWTGKIIGIRGLMWGAGGHVEQIPVQYFFFYLRIVLLAANLKRDKQKNRTIF